MAAFDFLAVIVLGLMCYDYVTHHVLINWIILIHAGRARLLVTCFDHSALVL